MSVAAYTCPVLATDTDVAVAVPDTVTDVNVPTEVIVGWAAVVTVPAVVAVDALPVNAPTNVVEVTDVRPANVVEVEPNAILVDPTVTELFNNFAFAILPANIVFVTVPVLVVYTPLVTVPALPVTEPVIGFVTVKLANVPTLVKLEAVTPTARVAPVNVPAAAATVPLAPSAIAVPLTVTELLVNAAFGIAVKLVPVNIGAVTNPIVTAPVAPDTVTFVPATLDVTPVFANVLPVKDKPVPAVYDPEPENCA